MFFDVIVPWTVIILSFIVAPIEIYEAKDRLKRMKAVVLLLVGVTVLLRELLASPWPYGIATLFAVSVFVYTLVLERRRRESTA